MVNINWLGGVIFLLNLVLFFLLMFMRRIGPVRSAGISGWVAMLFGALVLVIQKGITAITSSIALVMGIVSVFGVIFVIIPALSPHANLGLLKYPIRFFTFIGWFIGYIVAAILAFL